MSAEPIAAILLAAGESRRMGHPKPLLPWLGTTLIAYQVEQLTLAGAAPIVVVLGAEARRAAVPLRGYRELVLVFNPLYSLGKTTSLQAGVRALPSGVGALLVLAVDQPRRSETLQQLLNAHLQGSALITTPVYRGRRGHPPVLSSPLLPDLHDLLEEEQGLRGVMRRYQSRTQQIPVESPEVLLDLNSPEDYRGALAFFERLQL